MSDNAGQDLDALLGELAAAADGVQASPVVEGTQYSRSGRPFAVGSAAAAEFRLDPEVAEAARRTPDAGPSTRGHDWVRFVPLELDRHARDRVEAWFRSAWRAAGAKR